MSSRSKQKRLRRNTNTQSAHPSSATSANPKSSDTKDMDHIDYWNRVSPRLLRYVQDQRDQAFDQVLLEALALYSFITEGLKTKATKNSESVEKLGSMVVLTQDILRGLIASHRELSPVSLAALNRIAIEIHINLRFITGSSDPIKYADRYFRFQEIEKLIHDEKRLDPDLSMLPAGKKEEIKKTCPEWIEPTGKLKTYWTAESALRKVIDIAKAAGLEGEYRGMYSMTSKFIHGSAIVTSLYSGPRGVNAIGQRAFCKRLASITLDYCTNILKDLCSFFGVTYDRTALTHWRLRKMEACKDVA